MKKLTATIISLLLVFSLAACGSGNTGGNGGAGGDAGASPEPTPAATAEATETNEVIDEDVNSVSVLELTGEANIERGAEELSARAGMRLQNLDTMRTMAESAAWLLLEEDRAVELGENSALHIDRQSKGFVLTLTAGEVTARIDKPLSDGEEFTVKAGNLALAVRGTIFTVRIDGAIVTVSVERGEVAVIDSSGNELTTIGEDESVSFDTSAGNAVVAAPAQSSNDNYEVGDIVGFGGYEWRVLEVSDGKALLLSEYVLELRPYNGEWRDDLTFDENIAALSTTWADCDLRAYLNGEFYDSLGADIKARIVETQVVNDDNPEYGTPGGADTNDKIFLLSIDEAEAYFSDDTARIAYDSSGAASWWWLRSPGYGSRYAALVGRGGDVDVNGIYGIYIGYGGVRPALWLNL